MDEQTLFAFLGGAAFVFGVVEAIFAPIGNHWTDNHDPKMDEIIVWDEGSR